MKRLLTIAAVVLWAGVACAQSNFKYNGLSYTSTGVTFANLAVTPPQTSGTTVYCSDCTQTLTCAAGGLGAMAKLVAGVWKCADTSATGSLTDPLLLNTLTGTGVAPTIAGYNGAHDNEKNIMAYGAAGAVPGVTTGTISGGTNSLTVVSASGWKASQGIIVPHAGAANTLSAASAPTITNVGTGGAASYSYKVVPLDTKHGHPAASAAGSTATGNATLSSTNFNRIKWTAVANAWGYAVYQTAPAAHLIAITTDTYAADYGQSAFTNDTYLAKMFWDISGTTAPAGAEADWLQTTISSINGTTFTLAASATTTATSVGITHDDTAPITNAMGAGGTPVYFPAGSYFFCGTPLATGTYQMRGAGENSTIIYTCQGQYLINDPNFQFGIDIGGFTFVGGQGAYHQTYTQAITSGQFTHTIHDNAFLDYTNDAIDFGFADFPFFKVENNAFEPLDANTSIGVVASSSSGQQLDRNNFQGNRIGLKCTGACGGVNVRDNSFLHIPVQANPLKPRISIWHVTSAGDTFETGSGFAAIGNKFGNENFAPDDLHALVAREDSASGTDVSNRMPLYVTLDDAAITNGAAGLTSAAECPFTSTMCQGGAGCTGSSGNWNVLIEGALTTSSNHSLTTTITAFTNTCSVTVGASANATITGGTARMAPDDTVGTANYLNYIANMGFSLGGQSPAFIVSTTQNQFAYLTQNRIEITTGIENLHTFVTPAFNVGDYFINNPGLTYNTNQDLWMLNAVNVGSMLLGVGNNNDGLVSGNTVPRVTGLHASGGIGVEGTFAPGATPFPIFGAYANDGSTLYFEVDGNGNIKANGHSIVDQLGTLLTSLLALNPTLFANLATPGNGSVKYCSDCTIANPCAGGGTGAIAKRLNGVWVCN